MHRSSGVGLVAAIFVSTLISAVSAIPANAAAREEAHLPHRTRSLEATQTVRGTAFETVFVPRDESEKMRRDVARTRTVTRYCDPSDPADIYCKGAAHQRVYVVDDEHKKRGASLYWGIGVAGGVVLIGLGVWVWKIWEDTTRRKRWHLPVLISLQILGWSSLVGSIVLLILALIRR